MHRSPCCLLLCLAILIAMPLPGAERSDEAEAAERKAQRLEQAVVEEGEAASVSPGMVIDKPEAQAVDPEGEQPLDDALTCLVRTIYWEARGEAVADMEAVASVVINRLAHEGFPDTVCGVVRQGLEQGDCQFSWWCDGRVDEADEEGAYDIAKEIARRALNQQLPDRTDGALYFHLRTMQPDWAAQYTKTVDVGGFAFYRPQEGAAR
ncbi:cell wall hydrolase [Halomonas organivorans]|uniref:Spore germination cell wall hydrolase CwlJ-like protein n=1 Tax=Halomonas organivorans TaxID=257772 RepID=A0A7W5BVQ1_9GAMM|nr:cell wall hydrolase [Halomonas organivorans]MBB3139966.1 spore germination cell wall hydrolase CwlJ-like protein [Halomonas organivorans]